MECAEDTDEEVEDVEETDAEQGEELDKVVKGMVELKLITGNQIYLLDLEVEAATTVELRDVVEDAKEVEVASAS